MLTLQNITITTPKGRVLVNDLSFSIQAGDKMAIIGEEGNGKSTVCKLIATPASINETLIVEGKVTGDTKRIGYLPQWLQEEKLNTTLIDFVLNEEGWVDYEKVTEMKRWMADLNVGIPEERYDDPLKRLSGGERIKIQLVRLMLKEPELLVLDEPTNDLDLNALRWFEEFILSTSLPILFVSHDETLLKRCANRILHLEQTQRKTVPLWTCVSCGYDEYVSTRLHLIDRQTTLSRKQRAEYEKQLEKWRQIYQKVEHAQATISRQDPAGARLLKKKIKNLKAVRDRLDGEEKIKKPDPEESITLFFQEKEPVYDQKCLLDDALPELKIGDRVLARNLELTIYGRARIGLIGDNGSGKTTYLAHLQQKARERGTKIGYMPQNYDERLPLSSNAVDFLTQDGTKEEKTRIMTYLGNLKFTEEEMRQPISACSQGQKAKILLVSLVLGDNDLLILDEPTRNLSPLTLPVVEEMLDNYHGAILAVSHDRRFLLNVTRTRYVLRANGLENISQDFGYLV